MRWLQPPPTLALACLAWPAQQLVVFGPWWMTMVGTKINNRCWTLHTAHEVGASRFAPAHQS